jgi:5,10-methylenetetrahydrofolate reductase
LLEKVSALKTLGLEEVLLIGGDPPKMMSLFHRGYHISGYC